MNDPTVSSSVPSPIVVTTPAPAAHTESARTERRQLIIILAAIEGVLLLLPAVLGSYVWAQPVPVDQGPGTFGCVSSGETTAISPGSSCGPVPFAPFLALLVVLSVILALLVLPVLMGFLSRRWQTAVAAPCIPVWALTVLAAGVITLDRASGLSGFGDNNPIQSYNLILSLVFTTPLILMIAITAALGGLAWLVHRGFMR